VLAVGMVALLGACGNGGTPPEPASGSCGPSVTEPLDPSSAVHLLPGAAEPEYLSDPPTSGPHLSGRPPAGAVEEPLDRPTQVLVLEQGGVLIQYRDVEASAVASLESLAAESVVVAPNPHLAAPMVATAWRTKRTCTAADLEALREFVDVHLGQGPEGRP
jgi:hypothetical protein